MYCAASCLAFLEHDLDGARKRFYRNVQRACQTRFVMYRSEGLPKQLGIMAEPMLPSLKVNDNKRFSEFARPQQGIWRIQG
jgi:hypothetical protein